MIVEGFGRERKGERKKKRERERETVKERRAIGFKERERGERVR